MRSKLSYRIWQFWQSLERSPGDEVWGKVRAILSSEELELFQQLPIPDQNHSIRVLLSLEKTEEDDPDLIKSALLHDLGKIKHPLKRWERVFAVLVMAIFPRSYRSWSRGSPTGLKRPLVVIAEHPQWGGELARSIGCSARVIWLIQNHENQIPGGDFSEEDLLILRKLQKADNQN